MSGRYKIRDGYRPHFIPSTVVGWADALSRPEYKDIIVYSLDYCRRHKNLLVHAWVLMNNHLHLVPLARMFRRASVSAKSSGLQPAFNVP